MVKEHDEGLLEKVANCLAMGFEYDEIAAVCGRSVAEIQEIESSEQFKAFITDQALEEYQDAMELSDLWSAIETRSLQIVGQRLTTTRDADFALRAAVVANKAIRRGKGSANQTLVVNNDQRTVLNLPVTFVQQIRTGDVEIGRPQTQQKEIDQTHMSTVEKVLGVARDALDSDIKDIFQSGELALAPAE